MPIDFSVKETTVDDFLVGYFDTPIFRSLICERRFSGLDFPVKPKGFVAGEHLMLKGYTTGIEPLYNGYKRQVRVDKDDPIYDLVKDYI